MAIQQKDAAFCGVSFKRMGLRRLPLHVFFLRQSDASFQRGGAAQEAFTDSVGKTSRL